MSKHTPGPWKVDPSNSFEVVTNDRDLVAMTYDREYYGYYESITDEQKEANARLIAAAPDLYETLCSMIHVLTEIATATKLDLEKTVIKAKDQATGKEASVSAMTVFIDALSVISKVSGETNE